MDFINGTITTDSSSLSGTNVGQNSLNRDTIGIHHDRIQPREGVRPELAVTGSKKHGVNWKEGPARAKKTGKPQGRWAISDLEYASEMANTLGPREYGDFNLPEDSESVVYMPDGTIIKASKMWIRNNGTGTWHGYPKP